MSRDVIEMIRRLLRDRVARDRLRAELEAVAGPIGSAAPRDGIEQDAAGALVGARRAYAGALLDVMEDEFVPRAALTRLANVAACRAVAAGRDGEARRWLRVAEVDAAADELDGPEVVHAWASAIEYVAGAEDSSPLSADDPCTRTTDPLAHPAAADGVGTVTGRQGRMGAETDGALAGTWLADWIGRIAAQIEASLKVDGYAVRVQALRGPEILVSIPGAAGDATTARRLRGQVEALVTHAIAEELPDQDGVTARVTTMNRGGDLLVVAEVRFP